jgi:hypothetical protein
VGWLVTLCRVKPGGKPVFAFDPREGASVFSVLVSPAEYAHVIQAGVAYLDGQPARPVVGECDEASGFLHMRLDEPYRKPGRLSVAA